MADIRKPAVANLFYPEEKINLKRMINSYLSEVSPNITDYFTKNNIDNLLGIICPHAGYIYSGPVAAYGYSLLKQRTYDTVILIGPSHRHIFDGFALSKSDEFETPFGNIEIDREFSDLLIEKGKGIFDYLDTAHSLEHSLEVQLPFLQTTLQEGFRIVPIIMGYQVMEYVIKGADVLQEVLEDYDKSYLFVISSDLSHVDNQKVCNQLDKEFIGYLEKMDTEKIMEAVTKKGFTVCGGGPIAVMLEIAKRIKRNHIKVLDYRTSNDTHPTPNASKVVGYLSAVVW